jgi:toxin YoeB
MIHIAPSRTRPRIRPTWTAGLRRGRERDATMRYLESSPRDYERLLRIIRDTRPANYQPMRLDGVRLPFDYDRRHDSRAPLQPAPQERDAVLQIEFRRDLTFWIESDRRVAIRVMRLVDEVMRDPFYGTAKPELLKHTFRGHWSRRLTTEHRIV